MDIEMMDIDENIRKVFVILLFEPFCGNREWSIELRS